MKDLQLMVNNPNPKQNYQREMVKYLKSHPKLNVLRVEILQECTEPELQAVEQMWLDASDPQKLFNITTNARKTSRDVGMEKFSSGIYSIDFRINTFDELAVFKKLTRHNLVVGFSKEPKKLEF